MKVLPALAFLAAASLTTTTIAAVDSYPRLPKHNFPSNYGKSSYVGKEIDLNSIHILSGDKSKGMLKGVTIKEQAYKGKKKSGDKLGKGHGHYRRDEEDKEEEEEEKEFEKKEEEREKELKKKMEEEEDIGKVYLLTDTEQRDVEDLDENHMLYYRGGGGGFYGGRYGGFYRGRGGGFYGGRGGGFYGGRGSRGRW